MRLHARSWHRYPEPPPDATALIIYTSGTTGPPKGVVVSRRAIAADIDALAEAWQWTPDDTLVHGLPLFHVHGLVLGLLGSLRIGNRFVHTGKPTPAAYAGGAAARCTSGCRRCGRGSSPTRTRRDALASARLLVSGSAPLPVPVFDKLARLTGHQPVERYGSTESLITLSTRADGERRPGWVGLPLTGVQTRLVDDDGAAVPHDGETIGRLQVRGPTMFDGYLNRPDATAEAFDADGWYRTGDVAVIDGDGMHRIVGRESVDLIKSGGYRVGAGEIETVLLGHPGVAEAAVVGAPDDDLGQRIVAFVVGDAEPQALIDFVAQAAFGAQAAAGGATGGEPAAQRDGQGAQEGVDRMALTFDEICIDAHDAAALGAWWSKVLGWRHYVDEDGDVVLEAPSGAGPNWLFIDVPDDKVVKNRIHLDFRPDDQQAEVDRVIGLGARHVDIGQGEQTWVVLADPEGNEFCILAARRLMRQLPRVGGTPLASWGPTPRARGSPFAGRHAGFRVHFAHARRPLGVLWATALLVVGCATAVQIEPVSTTEPAPPPEPLTIGPAATDTYGGWIPDGQTLSPFDVSNPALAQLDPALLNAIQDAARAAAVLGHRPADQLRLAIKGLPAAAV